MALSWSGKRQLLIALALLAVALFFVYLFIAPYLKTEATCFDGRQNNDEAGVDCGGSCDLLCPFQNRNIIIRWARSFPVTSNIYNAVAYIENPNVNTAIKSIAYEFRFYDKDNVFITSRSGKTFIGPTGKFLIFEPGINVGARPVSKTLFNFTEAAKWTKIDERLATFPLFVRGIDLTNPNSAPRITARVSNDSIYDLRDLDIVAIVYDEAGNALATSKTFLDLLPKSSSAPVFFTWPAPFGSDVGRIDVFPDLNPFTVNF